MRRALYFPHTEVRSESIVRTALLTWDALECIVPYREYAANYADPLVARAMEMIGEKRVVTDEEQVEVHQMVEELLDSGVPEIFRYSPTSDERNADYELWPQKMANRTWNLLAQHGLVGGHLSNQDFPTTQAAGLSLMAILADVLAGKTRARITDQSIAYAAIANAMKSEVSGPNLIDVVPITLKAVSLDDIPLVNLIKLRELEAKDPTGDFRVMRHNYLDVVDKHVVSLSQLTSKADRIELDIQFTETMNRDFLELKRQLGYERSQMWLSAGALTLVATAATVAASAFAGHLMLPEVTSATGSAVFIGGLLQGSGKFAKARRDLILNSPTAYLLQLPKKTH